MDSMLQYVKPELVILVLALYFLGVAFKNAEKIDDRWIPLLLTGCGILCVALFVLAHRTEYPNFAAGAFESITQGTTCAGMSVYIHQLMKQSNPFDSK